MVNVNYTLPNDFPENAKNLIQKLIVTEPSKRLGVKEQGGYETLKQHVFYENINWNNLSEQDAPNPIKENVSVIL